MMFLLIPIAFMIKSNHLWCLERLGIYFKYGKNIHIKEICLKQNQRKNDYRNGIET